MEHTQEEETGGEEGEPNIEEYFAKTWEQFGLGRDDPAHSNKPV
jgi:hypothetical protein